VSALPRFTLALLLAALALSGTLAVQAHRAAASHRATAEHVLHAYAAVSAWEVGNVARQELLATNFVQFAPVLRAHAGGVDAALLDTLAASLARQEALCACSLGARRLFRYEFRGTATTVVDAAGRPAPADTGEVRWLRATLGAVAASMPATGAPTPVVVRAPNGYPRLLGYAATHTVQATSFGVVRGRPTALAAQIVRTTEGAPVSAVGYTADPDAVVRPLFARILEKQHLLPPVLLGARSVDSLLSLAVRDEAGRELYRSRARFAPAYSAVERLEPRFGALRLQVALNPAAAGQLIIGGLPQSRLPALLALFAVTAGLTLVAVAQLRRQQALTRMRADFVSGVSHELRTPLAQIRLLAELLHMGRPGTEGGRRRAARIIDQESRRLTYLVENVLAFSRGERGATRLAPAVLDVAREVGETLDMFAPLAEAAGSRVVLRAGAPVRASVDGAALRQIVLNLLDNATRYGPRGQTVLVGVECAAAAGGRPAARVWVEDEGPGVPAAERARIWAPYYRLERDAVVTGGGSGIGLSVVRDLVQRHGGRVWVEDGRRGARFVLEFAAEAPAEAAPADAPAGGAPDAPRVGAAR
jgi:signal transduction histidine kinase